jgi:Uma2 family endonuclease
MPEEQRFHELYDGELHEKAAPSAEHGDAQSGVVTAVRGPFQRKPGNGGPGGWWIMTEVEVLLLGQVVRPDVVGWRRETCPERPTGAPVAVRPDWICEVLSTRNATTDTVRKLRLYQRAGVPYYWIADPQEAMLSVMRLGPDGYITLLAAERQETIRPEPFGAIELFVGSLFGDDPPES